MKDNFPPPRHMLRVGMHIGYVPFLGMRLGKAYFALMCEPCNSQPFRAGTGSELHTGCLHMCVYIHECIHTFQVERLQSENRRHATNRLAVEQLFTQKLDLAHSERYISVC